MSWFPLPKVSKWLYLKAKIDDFEVYELFDDNLDYWSAANFISWIRENYRKRIREDSEITLSVDLIEYNAPEE